MVFADWLVIGVGGKVSSLNAPAGVGGSKSKSKISYQNRAELEGFDFRLMVLILTTRGNLFMCYL